MLNMVMKESTPSQTSIQFIDRRVRSPILGAERDNFIREAQSESYIFDTVITSNEVSGASIVTIANYGYKDMTLNWIASLLKTRRTKFVVFCYDEDLLIYLAERGYRGNVALVPTTWLQFNLTKDVYNERVKEEFDRLVQSRMVIWSRLASRGRSFLFCDADLVFLSEHVFANVQFNYKNSFADILFSIGRPVPRFVIYNTGFFYATPTEFVKSLFGLLFSESLKSTDQLALNDMIYRGVYRDRKIPIDTLDRFLYTCSTLYFVEKMNDKHNIEPLMVHASQRPYKLKLDFLKSRNFWYLNEHEDQDF
jgi:hypothetical protein